MAKPLDTPHSPRVLNFWRFSFGVFGYSIGWSWWRKAGNMRVIDAGYLKFVYWSER